MPCSPCVYRKQTANTSFLLPVSEVHLKTARLNCFVFQTWLGIASVILILHCSGSYFPQVHFFQLDCELHLERRAEAGYLQPWLPLFGQSPAARSCSLGCSEAPYLAWELPWADLAGCQGHCSCSSWGAGTRVTAGAPLPVQHFHESAC